MGKATALSNKFAAVRYIECGHKPKEAAELAGVTVERVYQWWKQLHPGLPIPKSAPKAGFLRRIGHIVRRVDFDIYECPFCGGVIYQPQINAPKPWHCPWCGKDVR